MKTLFYTIATKSFQNRGNNSHNVDYVGFVNSFKKFHPDCQLITIDETFLKNNGLGLLNPKATIGRLGKEQNPDANICVLDCDHLILARLDEILAANYDIACPDNYNILGNVVGIKVKSGLNGNGNEQWLVDEKEFLQGGLIASPSLQFWKHYEWAVNNRQLYKRFTCYENDILNIVAYTYPYTIKVLDRDAANIRQSWYGCSIIGKEKECYVKDGQIMLEGSPVKAYHFAHGSAKRKYDEIFTPDVAEHIKGIIG